MTFTTGRAGRWFAGAVAVGSIAAAGCSAVSPPPLIPMHAGTAPAPRGETTVTVILGIAGEIFGGEGWGLAVRTEQQVGDATALGAQIGLGLGEEGEKKDGKKLEHWLLELRTYARVASPSHDWAAGLGSVGLSLMDTGLRSLTLALGGAISYPNEDLVPALGVFGAVSILERRGRGFGPDHDKFPHTTWWIGASAGLQVPVGREGKNVPSIEAGLASGNGPQDSAQLSLSIADGQRF